MKKNHDKLAVCQFTWYLGITMTHGMNFVERGDSVCRGVYVSYGLFTPRFIQGVEESIIPVSGRTLTRCMQNVMQSEKLLLLINKLHPASLVAPLGSKSIRTLSSISAK